MRRVCVNGNTCVGSMAKYEDCNTDSCPEGICIYTATIIV